MFDDEIERDKTWDATDIKMAIKRYFYNLSLSDSELASREVEFMRSIHREWSLHPLMRRTGPEAMAIIDDFLKYFDSKPSAEHSPADFTIVRLLK